MKYYSHRNKELQCHINGINTKIRKRGFYNQYSEFNSLFHDIAKINEYFRLKLFGQSTGKYDKHSYLSLYISYCVLISNSLILQKYKSFIKENKLFLNIVANIIARHHSDLKNIDDICNQEEIDEMFNFLESNQIDFNNFLNEHFPEYKQENFKMCDLNKDKFNHMIYNDAYLEIWQKDALKYFFDTTFNFAQLVEADKRDASDNEYYKLKELSKFNYTFNNNLKKYLDIISEKIELNHRKIELNLIRTKLRLESEKNLRNSLEKTNQRMFVLQAPTGSGKTLMMLNLATTIQEIKGDYGVIISLPFTTITDQTANICNKDLLLEELNYTSVSNCSKVLKEIIKDGETSSDKNLEKLLTVNFSMETFDNPLVITTFVQFFQTLMSNLNSVLLKLPNFTKRIFLIDEIQALPSNLYTFFYGILQHFCERFDCYTIISTATMPHFSLNNRKTDNGYIASDVFKNFKEPTNILDVSKYINNPVFNRYLIENIGDKNIDELIDTIKKHEKSTLIIMNTKGDSYDVYQAIKSDKKYLLNTNVYLLNTNLDIFDRLRILANVKADLDVGKKVILVTTQLVEAGIDIDFPIVYRDTCPLSSLIQSAGRGNRNYIYDMGYIYMFNFYKLNNKNEKKYRANLIYSKFDLDFVKDNIKLICEKDLHNLQSKYYNTIQEYKTIGRVSETCNLIDLLMLGKIQEIGNFRLIEKSDDEFKYYVGGDVLWNKFREIYNNKPDIFDYKLLKKYKIELSIIQKEISRYCVNVRGKEKNELLSFTEEILEIRNLNDKEKLYSPETGLSLYNDDIEFRFI